MADIITPAPTVQTAPTTNTTRRAMARTKATDNRLATAKVAGSLRDTDNHLAMAKIRVSLRATANPLATAKTRATDSKQAMESNLAMASIHQSSLGQSHTNRTPVETITRTGATRTLVAGQEDPGLSSLRHSVNPALGTPWTWGTPTAQTTATGRCTPTAQT